jgi:hypothetical protein
VRHWQRLAIGDNWNHLMRLRDMKYIGFKHQRENKQNSDKNIYLHLIHPTSDDSGCFRSRLLLECKIYKSLKKM